MHEWLQMPSAWNEMYWAFPYRFELSATTLKTALEQVCISKSLDIDTTLAVLPQHTIKGHGVEHKCTWLRLAQYEV